MTTFRLPNRRALLCAAASAATLCALLPAQAQAQAQAPYPNKPIRMVVPFAAGGATDVLARVIGQKMSAGMGQPVIIDNKPGAAGIIGTDAVAKSAPDGYTIVLGLSNSLMTNEFLYEKLPYDTARDLTLVYQIAAAPLVLVVHPSVPANSLKELVALSQREPLSFAVTAIGSPPHLAGVAVEQATGARWQYIPYKGGAQAINDTMGGQAQVLMNGMLATLPHVQSGKLKVLAVSKRTRMPTSSRAPGRACWRRAPRPPRCSSA